ncbi:MAG: HipA domain-containing protein [Lachnospiraceae bacterium]
MKRLSVWIEIEGVQTYVGDICGEGVEDSCFSYAKDYYMDSKHKPISIHLPFSDEAFSPKDTRNFFEGLLPEGFTRRCVAGWMHADENDYLTLLSGLGKECLGAIRIINEEKETIEESYKKLTIDEVKQLAKEGAEEAAELVTKAHLSLTGASGKVGLYYDEASKGWYLPIGSAPSTHIVKQSHIRLDGIVTNEQLCLMTAKNMGIEIPDSFVVNVGDGQDEDVLFATRRYDRIQKENAKKVNGFAVPYRLHQEDFSQAMGIAAIHKYEHDNAGYLKKMFDILRQYSSDPMADQLKLWDICVFNYLIGNTDNHIKNVSLLYGEDLQSIRLAPAYDIVSTVIYKSSTRDMAFSIGQEYDIGKITRESFRQEARNIGLGENVAMKHFDRLADAFSTALEKACEQLMQEGFIKAEDIKKRIVGSRGGRKGK